jgi:hypothetical protein
VVLNLKYIVYYVIRDTSLQNLVQYYWRITNTCKLYLIIRFLCLRCLVSISVRQRKLKASCDKEKGKLKAWSLFMFQFISQIVSSIIKRTYLVYYTIWFICIEKCKHAIGEIFYTLHYFVLLNVHVWSYYIIYSFFFLVYFVI